MPSSFDDHTQWYDLSLKIVSNSAEIIYTYENAIHGFAIRMAPGESKLLEGQPGILSVQEEVTYELHTTRSPSFLGLEKHEAQFPTSN